VTPDKNCNTQGRTQGGGGVRTPPQLRSSSFSLHLILKMIATSGFLTALECTKFVFGVGAYSAPPDSLAGIRGALLPRGGERKEREGREGKG